MEQQRDNFFKDFSSFAKFCCERGEKAFSFNSQMVSSSSHFLFKIHFEKCFFAHLILTFQWNFKTNNKGWKLIKIKSSFSVKPRQVGNFLSDHYQELNHRDMSQSTQLLIYKAPL